jgi:hypothetical protein
MWMMVIMCMKIKRGRPGKRREVAVSGDPLPPAERKPKIKRVKVAGKGKGRKRGPGLKNKKAVSQKK